MNAVSHTLKAILLSIFLWVAAGAEARVLPAVKQSADNVGLIFVQGMGVDVDAYATLASEIQQQSNLAVWVALVNFPLNVPNPLLYFKVTDGARAELKKAGMPGDTYYIVGHSLGGTIAQMQEANLRGGMEDGSPGVNTPRVQGMILLASYVTRKNQFILSEMPILTLGGELDGMTRIGRLAEAYAHQLDAAPEAAEAASQSPVVVLPGVNHRHFFTGGVPFPVTMRDLASPLAPAEARHAMGRVISAFLATNLQQSADDGAVLRAYVTATGSLVRPLIDAMWLEGSYHLRPPCTASGGEAVDQHHCQKGSPWAEQAAVLMAGDIPHVTIQDTSAFHESWRMFPFFHAHILNSCPLGQDCVMHLDNSVQNVYSMQDNYDTAFDPVAASQMRVKMKSRQAVLQAAGYGVQDFKHTDEWDACAAINQKALEWAEQHAPAATLARYRAQGLPVVMGSDIPQGGGPTFIWSPIQQKVVKRADGSKVLEIRVQTMRTPLDQGIAHAAGYHYCKLVSPAWFMEWIFTDSLRSH